MAIGEDVSNVEDAIGNALGGLVSRFKKLHLTKPLDQNAPYATANYPTGEKQLVRTPQQMPTGPTDIVNAPTRYSTATPDADTSAGLTRVLNAQPQPDVQPPAIDQTGAPTADRDPALWKGSGAANSAPVMPLLHAATGSGPQVVTDPTYSAEMQNAPKLSQANYFQAADETSGAPHPAAMTKLGKLLFLGQHMAEGAAIGSTQRGFGPGFMAAQQNANEQALTNQRIQEGGMQLQQQRQQMRMMPLLMQMQAQRQQAELGETLAKTRQERFIPTRSGAIFDTQTQDWAKNSPVKGSLADLQQAYADAVTDEVDAGRDPMVSQRVKRLAAGLQAVQKQTPQKAPPTIRTKEGVMQYNPTSQRYDIRAGGLPPTGTGAGLVTPANIVQLGEGVKAGKISPALTGLGRGGVAAAVQSYLASQGFDLASAQLDWEATKRYLGTLNGPQQQRLQQNIRNARESLGKIQQLYQDWAEEAVNSGFRDLNAVTMAAMEHLPGHAGAVAQNLRGQIADITTELAGVYMGGNSPTDHAMGLASQNLAANWNQETFEMALDQIEKNLTIRENSINQGAPAGAGGGPSRYFKPPAAGGGGSNKAAKPTFGVSLN